MIDEYLVKDAGLLTETDVKKGTRFTPEQGLSLFFNGKRAIERYERCLEVCASMHGDALRGEATGSTVEQYKELHDTLCKNLFEKVFPKKLDEAKKADDGNKVQEITNNWKRLLIVQRYNQDLKPYGIS